MLAKATALLLTIFSTTQVLATDLPVPLPLYSEPTCYTSEQTSKIAKGLRELNVCKAQLAEAEKFVASLNQQQASAIEWWQEAPIVVGGIVVSFGISAILTTWAVSKAKK
jgi:hypothetical protein